MGKPPDYNPTVPQTNSTAAPGAEYEALVDREHVVAVSGTPTTSDAFPTAGRVAADTSTSPPTYYIGDGSSWLQARPGGIHNPDAYDIPASEAVPTASYGAEDPYVLKVNASAGAANLTGFTHPDAVAGQRLIVMGASNIQNAVTIKDNNASATNAFQTTSGSDQTVDAASDLHVFVFDGTDWAQIASGAGN